MKRSPKQDELFKAFKSGKYNEFVLAGGANASKTYGILMLLNAICEMCPGVRLKGFRLSDRNIQENLIPSYQKVLKDLGRSVPIVSQTARYENGSQLLFGWADITKDRDCDNAKGGEYAFMFFNEANQIAEQYINVAQTRLGRFSSFEVNGKPYYIKPAIFIDCNPTNNWVKTRYHDKYRDGTLPPNVFYQESTPYDNPFIMPEALAILENLPETERQRYLLGNWEYNDDINLLIPYEYIKNNLIDVMPENNHPVKYLGCDVARYGDDETVMYHISDDVVYDSYSVKKQDTVDTAKRIMFEAETRSIGYKHIGVDVVGLGAGVVDRCTEDGYNVYAYNSGESPETRNDFYLFKNKRAEAHWMLREDLKEGKLKILNNGKCKKAIEQLTQIKYYIEDKVIRIESKEDTKKRIGSSPDHADALIIANYMRRNKSTPAISIKRNKKTEPSMLTRSF